ncbi:Uu.00g040040.m01.CDS01 [Anthostomella pinea]|uniref:Uu.00g040040.m01.CDS01 n=1 Tax=Anthostomella pinea TaxID=933095 RepID=A0AAI8YDT2_9PEZI|nr:Uu.00g040040.m01.CDS01 [Anthostomella pinea]
MDYSMSPPPYEASSYFPLQIGMRPSSPPGVPFHAYHVSLPSGPPPGLVRVERPAPSPICRLTNSEISLFGDIALYFDHPYDLNGHPVVVDLTCTICADCTLEMPANESALRPGLGPDPVVESMVEPLAVLPCGHMFGSRCLDTWLSSKDVSGEVPTCPQCRFELYHPARNCGHYLAPKQYSPQLSRSDQIPWTIPEGGSVPGECEACVRAQTDYQIERLEELLFPQVGFENYRSDDDERLVQGARLMFARNVEIMRHEVRERTLRW